MSAVFAVSGLSIKMTNSDEQLEQRLGYKFQNPALLQRALTHSSAIPELRMAQIEHGR